MVRAVLLVTLLAACGGSAKGPPLAPLPPDPQPAAAAPTTPAEPAAPATPAEPAAPEGPLDLTVPAPSSTVKLVSAGRGKRAPLRIAAKPGAKQQVELALDFGITQSATIEGERKSQADVVPTVVLAGDAEAKQVAADGTATYALTITRTDARPATGSQVPLDKFKPLLEQTLGLVLAGTVGASGQTGEWTMHLDKQGSATGQIVDLVMLTLPPWPPLPAKPVGVGAKWQATRQTKLAGRLDVTETTTYEVVSYKQGVWKIRGKVAITGADQMMQGGKISKITGTGTSDITLVDGALYPSQATTVEATFTASEAEPEPGEAPKTLDFLIKLGGTITAK